MGEKKILVVEDDLNLGFLLMELLESAEFQVKLCRDGESGLATLDKGGFDLCLIDVMMPKLDGFSLAKEIRNRGIKVPFIFLTARSMKEDRLEGYGLGAEDYITKPFEEEELICKINVVLRRYGGEERVQQQTRFQLGCFVYDYTRQELRNGETSHRLTEKENEVLRLLCLHKNRVLRREEAVEQIYGKKDYFLGRSFDVYISRLRKLLKPDPSLEIQNIYKVGFILNETERA